MDNDRSYLTEYGYAHEDCYFLDEDEGEDEDEDADDEP